MSGNQEASAANPPNVIQTKLDPSTQSSVLLLSISLRCTSKGRSSALRGYWLTVIVILVLEDGPSGVEESFGVVDGQWLICGVIWLCLEQKLLPPLPPRFVVPSPIQSSQLAPNCVHSYERCFRQDGLASQYKPRVYLLWFCAYLSSCFLELSLLAPSSLQAHSRHRKRSRFDDMGS
jgi:hypothetical protein